MYIKLFPVQYIGLQYMCVENSLWKFKVRPEEAPRQSQSSMQTKLGITRWYENVLTRQHVNSCRIISSCKSIKTGSKQ